MARKDVSGNSGVTMTPQLKAWTDRFGDEYVDRNDYADWKMEPGVEAFPRILGGLDIESVLEVGSNIGLNLLFINELFRGGVKLYAVEPNRKAFDRLVSQTRMRLEEAWNCHAFQLPLVDSSIDLVFTAGFLIHIAPDDLGRATDEIVRVVRKYVLCIEYFSHTPVEVPYRGQMGLLFKRDFGAFYPDRFPNLKCVDYGFVWQREFPIFDNPNWSLFEKRAPLIYVVKIVTTGSSKQGVVLLPSPLARSIAGHCLAVGKCGGVRGGGGICIDENNWIVIITHTTIEIKSFLHVD